MRRPHTATKSRPCSLLEKSPSGSEDPEQPETNQDQIFLKFKRTWDELERKSTDVKIRQCERPKQQRMNAMG